MYDFVTYIDHLENNSLLSHADPPNDDTKITLFDTPLISLEKAFK